MTTSTRTSRGLPVVSLYPATSRTRIVTSRSLFVAILDFDVPTGLKFAIAKSPNSLFKTSYSMTALPTLNGSVGYIFTSCDLDIKSSGNTRVKDMIDRFRVYEQPRRPEGKEQEWLAGERVDNRGMYILLLCTVLLTSV